MTKVFGEDSRGKARRISYIYLVRWPSTDPGTFPTPCYWWTWPIFKRLESCWSVLARERTGDWSHWILPPEMTGQIPRAMSYPAPLMSPGLVTLDWLVIDYLNLLTYFFIPPSAHIRWITDKSRPVPAVESVGGSDMQFAAIGNGHNTWARVFLQVLPQKRGRMANEKCFGIEEFPLGMFRHPRVLRLKLHMQTTNLN